MWHYPLKTFSDKTAQTSSGHNDINHGMWLSSGRSALVVKLFAYTFFRNIFAHQDSAVNVYVHTCACPNKAAQMYFGRVSLKPVLEND